MREPLAQWATAVAIAAALWLPQPASADGSIGVLGDALALLVGVPIELMFPDMHYEVDADRGWGTGHWALTWPLALGLGGIDYGARVPRTGRERYRLELVTTAEYQYSRRHRASRGALALRGQWIDRGHIARDALDAGLGVYAEGGGVIGGDGRGGFLGAGITMQSDPSVPDIVLGYRRVWAGVGRHMVLLQAEYPLPWD